MENPAGHPKPPPNTDLELVVWLREQLDADAEAERRTSGGTWDYDPADMWITNEDSHVLAISDGAPGDIAHVTRYSPTAVLADIAAKRLIVDAVERYASWQPHPGQPCTNDEEHGGDPYQPCELHLDAYKHQPPQVDPYVLRLLASAYAHRPGYREEWRPT